MPPDGTIDVIERSDRQTKPNEQQVPLRGTTHRRPHVGPAAAADPRPGGARPVVDLLESSPLAPLLRDCSPAPRIQLAGHAAAPPASFGYEEPCGSVVRDRRDAIRAGLAGPLEDCWPPRRTRAESVLPVADRKCVEERAACVIICPPRAGSIHRAALWTLRELCRAARPAGFGTRA